MTKYNDVGTIGNFIPMAIRRTQPDFDWYRKLEMGFWSKLILWMRGK